MKIQPTKIISKSEKRTTRFGAERIKNFDAETNRASFAISSKSVDSYGEIVLPTSVLASWEEHYQRNPVFLWGHMRHHPDYYIGTCKNLWIHEDGRPSAEFEFDIEDEFAAKCARKVQKNIIRMTSIGFLPLEWVSKWDDEDKKKTLPDFAYKALKEDDCWVVFTKIRLLEISLVGIGANHEADNHNRDFEEFMTKHFESLKPIFEKYLEETETDMPAEKTKNARETFKEHAKKSADPSAETVEPVEVPADPPEPDGESEKDASELEELKIRVASLEESLKEAVECVTHLMKKDLAG